MYDILDMTCLKHLFMLFRVLSVSKTTCFFFLPVFSFCHNICTLLEEIEITDVKVMKSEVIMSLWYVCSLETLFETAK